MNKPFTDLNLAFLFTDYEREEHTVAKLNFCDFFHEFQFSRLNILVWIFLDEIHNFGRKNSNSQRCQSEGSSFCKRSEEPQCALLPLFKSYYSNYSFLNTSESSGDEMGLKLSLSPFGSECRTFYSPTCMYHHSFLSLLSCQSKRSLPILLKKC